MKKRDLSRLKEILDYDPSTGKVYTKKGRQLTPDDDGLVVVFDNQAIVRSVKHKLDKLAYYLAFGVYPRKDQKVLHRNLDEFDNSIKNLSLVSRSVYRQIKEAHKNLTGGIHLVPHTVDQFSYVIKWFDSGVEKSKIIQDIVIARKAQLKLQLKYSKILTKYCFFD